MEVATKNGKINILVTGATGYLGGRLAKYMAEECGYNVKVVARETSNIEKLKNIGCAIFYYDGSYNSLDNIFKNENIDTVFHLAAISNYYYKPEEISDIIDSNIKFGTHLLEAMIQNDCKKFVNTSTYWQHFSSEKYQPICLYAATKQAFEDIIEFYVFEHELAAISLKLFDIYGANDPRGKIFGLLKRAYESGETLDMTAGEQKITVVDADDAVRAYEIAASQLKHGEHKRFFIANPARPLKEIVQKYIEISGKDIKINWGAVAYRPKQIMDPYMGKILPNWKAENSLEDTIRKIVT